MLSQLFILSARGDTIVTRDYRHDVPRTSHEVFFRCLKFGAGDDGEIAPVFLQDGVNYFHVKVRRRVRCRRASQTSLGVASGADAAHCARDIGRRPVHLRHKPRELVAVAGAGAAAARVARHQGARVRRVLRRSTRSRAHIPRAHARTSHARTRTIAAC